MMSAHKQQVTIVRKSESSERMEREFQVKGRWMIVTNLWKSGAQRRRVADWVIEGEIKFFIFLCLYLPYIALFRIHLLWYQPYLSWTDSRSNWRPWCFTYFLFTFPLFLVPSTVEVIFAQFHTRWKLRSTVCSVYCRQFSVSILEKRNDVVKRKIKLQWFSWKGCKLLVFHPAVTTFDGLSNIVLRFLHIEENFVFEDCMAISEVDARQKFNYTVDLN